MRWRAARACSRRARRSRRVESRRPSARQGEQVAVDLAGDGAGKPDDGEFRGRCSQEPLPATMESQVGVVVERAAQAGSRRDPFRPVDEVLAIIGVARVGDLEQLRRARCEGDLEGRRGDR